MNATPITPESAPAICRGVSGGGAPVPPSSFLQTPFWGAFKGSHGWQPRYFAVSSAEAGEDSGHGGASGSSDFFLSVLVRRFTRFASVAYVPLGPDVAIGDAKARSVFLAELAASLRGYLPKNTLFIRFDPPWGTSVSNVASTDGDEGLSSAVDGVFPEPLPLPARKAPAHIQPPDTVQLDLRKSDDTLLAEMKSKWRYNIRLGEKKGVTIRWLDGEAGAGEGVDLFYGLYLETAARDGIAIHSRKYYGDLVTHAAASAAGGDRVSVRVYLAEHEGAVLASIITLFCGKEAVYLYGASSNEKRNLMPAYGLQWRAIRDAREWGCERYDFYGIPPTDDPGHPMYGLYRFKAGFGGSIVHRVGSYDIAMRSLPYRLYRMAEAARTFWFKRVTKAFRRETREKS